MKESISSVVLVSILACAAFFLLNVQEGQGVLPFAFLALIVTAEIISRKALRRKQMPLLAKSLDWLLLIIIGVLFAWWLL
jgi:hypothetical protein